MQNEQMQRWTDDAIRTEPMSYSVAKDRAEAISGLLLIRLSDAIRAAAAVDEIKRKVFYGKGLEGVVLNVSMPEQVSRLAKNMRLIHVAMGLITEAGEFAERVFNHVFEGKALDRVGLAEELGDTNWYERIGADELKDLFPGEPALAAIIQQNVDKLKARFPDKFTEERAIERDLTNERRVLEGKSDDFADRW